ncbi:DUF6678 family protein [Exiguobacterium aurantiacum]|uniref:DUF6678 family protein n=1 Tax=Exiguobacterium aurantiacum TaxID=33987 RepID=UPI00350E50EE
MCNHSINYQWRTKDIETGYVSSWDAEWYYYFKLGDYKYIEWLELKQTPRNHEEILLIYSRKFMYPERFPEMSFVSINYVGTGTYIDYI